MSGEDLLIDETNLGRSSATSSELSLLEMRFETKDMIVDKERCLKVSVL